MTQNKTNLGSLRLHDSCSKISFLGGMSEGAAPLLQAAFSLGFWESSCSTVGGEGANCLLSCNSQSRKGVSCKREQLVFVNTEYTFPPLLFLEWLTHSL